MTTHVFLRLGTEDWTHPAWQLAFYPEGLPSDWMLPYYNTRFQTVYLTADRWRRVAAADWQQWLDDTRAEFVFLLEDTGTPAPVASERVQYVTPAWADAHVWWLDDRPDLRALAGCIAAHAAAATPLFIVSRKGDLDLLQQVEFLRQAMGY